jgi:hypothetical protein
MVEDHDTRLVQEEAPHEVVAQAPQLGQLVDSEVPFECRFGFCHPLAPPSATTDGKRRDKHEARESLEETVVLVCLRGHA